jgi:hypothetical protein
MITEQFIVKIDIFYITLEFHITYLTLVNKELVLPKHFIKALLKCLTILNINIPF